MSNLANGQLAASSGTLLGVAPPAARRKTVNVTCYNTSAGSTETVLLTVAINGGTARGICRIDLAPYETLQVDNLTLDDLDILAGSASDASTVDYIVSESIGGEFDLRSLDSNGATKQVSSGVVGAQSITGAVTLTSTSASALAVGANGATNPVLKINANTGSVATGLHVTGAAAAGGLAVAVISSGDNEALTINAKGTGTIGIGTVSTGAVTLGAATGITGALTVTSAGASAFAVGRLGATTPALKVDASAATSVTGLLITAAASGAGLALSLTGGGAAENLTLDAKGTGTLTLQGTATGAITLGAATTLPDNAGLKLGTGNDIVLTWDGTDLDVTQAAENSSIKWGIDGAGIDQVWYGDTASTSMTWDQSADSLIFTGACRAVFTSTTGQSEIHLTDNLADAMSIKIPSGNDLMFFTTTNSAEAVVIPAALIVGSDTTDRVTIKGIYMTPSNVAVTIPSFAAETTDSVDVDVASALSMAPAVGDLVFAIPQEALPTDCLLAGAIVTATDTIRVSFDAKEGGGVTGAAKNFKFVIIDLT